MIQLSFDGRRLYVTNSLYSSWDNQFYPELRSWLLKVNCHPEGGMEVDRDFFVDFHARPDGPARAHEVRLQGATARPRSSNHCHGPPSREDQLIKALLGARGDPVGRPGRGEHSRPEADRTRGRRR
jgi:hypothetical protein